MDLYEDHTEFPWYVRVDGALRGKILPVGSIAVKYLYHIDHII